MGLFLIHFFYLVNGQRKDANKSSENCLSLQPSHKLCYFNETIHSGKRPFLMQIESKKSKLKFTVGIPNYLHYILGNRRKSILKNDVTCWRSSLHSFYVSYFFDLRPDMEVCKTNLYHSCTNITPTSIHVLQKFKII